MPERSTVLLSNTPPLMALTADFGGLDVLKALLIQTAFFSMPLVCIDEVVGRRSDRFCGLNLTGSWGVMLKARKLGVPLDLTQAIHSMQSHGIWLSPAWMAFVLGNLQ
jgi:predicted nucleic acid-binding protein